MCDGSSVVSPSYTVLLVDRVKQILSQAIVSSKAPSFSVFPEETWINNGKVVVILFWYFILKRRRGAGAKQSEGLVLSKHEAGFINEFWLLKARLVGP